MFSVQILTVGQWNVKCKHVAGFSGNSELEKIQEIDKWKNS